MVRLASWLAALSVFVSGSGVLAADPAAIQAAVKLPSMQLQAGVGYSPRTGLVDVDEFGSPEAAIARIRGGLKGDASDAPRYRTLGKIYGAQGQTAQSQQAYARAVELFDAALKQSPDDGALLAGKGDALAGKDDLTTAERFLKAELKRLPQAWQVRTALGRVLRQRSFHAFWPGKEGVSHDLLMLMNQQGADFPVLAAVRLKAQFPTAAQLKSAEALLGEADEAFDAAIKSAADLPEPYAERMAHRFAAFPQVMAIGGLQKLNAKPALDDIEAALRELTTSSQAAMLDPDTLGDARKVAELRRNDPQAWGLAAGMGRMVSSFLAEAGKDSTPAIRQALIGRFPALEGLSAKAKTELERMAKSASPQDAAAALESLGLIQYQEGDATAAEANLRKALSQDPLRIQSPELLAGILLNKGQFEEISKLYEGLLKHRDSTRNRLVLAKIYERLQKPEQVEAHLAAALTLDAADPSTRTYSAAYALRKQGAAGVGVAEQHLAAAEKALERKSGRFELLNVKYVRAAMLAVQSKPDAARKLLAEVLKEDEGHTAANALNAALK